MTNKSNTNYTDAQRVLDYLMNEANYGTIYDCYDGNHGWAGDLEMDDADISKIINADRKQSKFMWWNNRTMEFSFIPCVTNDGVYEGEMNLFDYRLYVEDAEALDFMKIDDRAIRTTPEQRLCLSLDEDEVCEFFEALDWDEDRQNAAMKAAYDLYFINGKREVDFLKAANA